MKHDAFTEAYLKIIKESTDVEVASNNEVTPTVAGAQPTVTNKKQICFTTSDEKLIDALNSGVEEIVLFVNAKDEETGEDTIAEVKFAKEAFEDLTISDVEEVVTEDGDIHAGDDDLGEGDMGGDDLGGDAE